jgi:hypothetical protein
VGPLVKRYAIAIAFMLSLWGAYEFGQHMDYRGVVNALKVPENGYIMANGMKITRKGITETIEKHGSVCSRCHFGEGY